MRRQLYDLLNVRTSFSTFRDVFWSGVNETDVKVENVTPGTHGHNLVLRIVSVTPLEAKKRQDGNAPRMVEAVVGDETGIVTLTARNGTFENPVPMQWHDPRPIIEQIDSLKEGGDVVIRNCNADVYNGYLRLNVTRWGKITPYPDGVDSTPNPPT